MKQLLLVLCLVLLVSTAVFSQQTDPPPAWNITLQPNSTASSNLSVVNQCRNTHTFQLQPQNIPFLNISQNQVQVSGGQTVNVPVLFSTGGLSTGMHQGQLVVACLTCRSEPTCTQDRETLQVIVHVAVAANPTPTPSPSPSGPVFNGPPRSSTAPDWKTGAKRTGVEYDRFLVGPCAIRITDCEELRKKAAELEAVAAAAQARSDTAKAAADGAESRAKAAEDASKKTSDAAKPGATGGTIGADGDTFTGADNAWLEGKRKKLFDDWQAGRISAEQQQAERAALSGPDALKKAREERLAHEAKLRKEAEEAKAANDKAQAEAAKAKADSDAATKAAAEAKAAADAALEEYRKCLKALEDECNRVAAEKKKKDDAAAAAAARQTADDKRRKDAEERAAAQQAEIDYLLDNFKRLGLITHLPNANIPDPLDPPFDALQKITGETIRNFLQSVAGQVGGGPIDPTYITALGEAYKAMSALFNMRTKAGLERVHRLLTTKIINPKTGKVYTDDQAWNKIKRMEDLMDKIKAALAASGK